jgi:DMSO/TMAO reductase YedYZ molybdopterin-dependent catalytic subunit
MNYSRRETLELSASALAALSLGTAAGGTPAAAQGAQKQAPAVPDALVQTPLRNIANLPLRPDGSAVEYTPADVGTIEGRPFWKTNGTPDIEFDYQKMKIRIDARGTANLAGTLTFSDLEKLPRMSAIYLLQCGAPVPRGIVKWTGVRFADFAKMVGAQPFANYVRVIGSDLYYLEDDMATLMHPQVMLAWMMNDQPIPPQHGAPLRLIVPFRYGARSMKAITDIQFTATSFPPARPWQT